MIRRLLAWLRAEFAPVHPGRIRTRTVGRETTTPGGLKHGPRVEFYGPSWAPETPLVDVLNHGGIRLSFDVWEREGVGVPSAADGADLYAREPGWTIDTRKPSPVCGPGEYQPEAPLA